MNGPRSEQQASALEPGLRLDDRYELLYPHAQGGMATVWAGRVEGKHGFEKLVAIKTILPSYADDPSFRKMFLDEARIASRIRHPNVAEIDDLGEDRGVLYMVLEWIDGDSWSKLWAAIQKWNHPIPSDVMLRIAADACAGLHAAHELRGLDGTLLNVIHRDVSPQNILVSTSGVTKVIDFGIAKALDRVTEQTVTGMLKGKLEYTSPEQVAMKRVDRRADLWAMGVCLYQLFTGGFPYPGKSDAAILRGLTSGKPPARPPPHVPEAISNVIMRALSPAIEARFQTALEMHRAIEGAMSRPITTTDVGACVGAYLADRIEGRRRDLGEALAEAQARGARRSRSSLASWPGSAAPLDDRGPASAPAVPGPAQASPSPAAPAAVAVAVAPRVPPSAAGVSELSTLHWAVMAAAAALTLGIWAFALTILLA